MEATMLPMPQRLAIFESIVHAIDCDMSITEARELTASKFGVDLAVVKDVEAEGRELCWTTPQ